MRFSFLDGSRFFPHSSQAILFSKRKAAFFSRRHGFLYALGYLKISTARKTRPCPWKSLFFLSRYPLLSFSPDWRTYSKPLKPPQGFGVFFLSLRLFYAPSFFPGCIFSSPAPRPFGLNNPSALCPRRQPGWLALQSGVPALILQKDSIIRLLPSGVFCGHRRSPSQLLHDSLINKLLQLPSSNSP